MTCIVGVVDDGGRVWIGGDRAAVDDWHCVVHVAQPKVFQRAGILFGYTSSFRMGQLLQHRLDIPERKSGQPVDEFMSVDFADAVRACLKDGGYTKIENSRETIGRFLVGIEGALYFFDDDYNVHRTIEGYSAAGSGAIAALGSLHTSALLNKPPKERLLWALSAAATHIATVRGPFDIISEN